MICVLYFAPEAEPVLTPHTLGYDGPASGRWFGPAALSWWGVAALLALLVSPAECTAAQAAAEYGHAVAGTGAGLTKFGKKVGSVLSTDKQHEVVHPAEPTGGAPEVANRRVLEQGAGKDAAKLSLDSVPAKARVRIDGKPVGQTPLLLSLAPGDYRVEMEGPRMESARRQVTILPHETRKVVLSLSEAPRYPTQIRLH